MCCYWNIKLWLYHSGLYVTEKRNLVSKNCSNKGRSCRGPRWETSPVRKITDINKARIMDTYTFQEGFILVPSGDSKKMKAYKTMNVKSVFLLGLAHKLPCQNSPSPLPNVILSKPTHHAERASRSSSTLYHTCSFNADFLRFIHKLCNL